MCRCKLCGPVSHNEAVFSVSLGREDRFLEVCRYCEQDFTLYGVKPNQTVRLEPSEPSREFSLFSILGSVASLSGKAGFEGYPFSRKHSPFSSASDSAPLLEAKAC